MSDSRALLKFGGKYVNVGHKLLDGLDLLIKGGRRLRGDGGDGHKELDRGVVRRQRRR